MKTLNACCGKLTPVFPSLRRKFLLEITVVAIGLFSIISANAAGSGRTVLHGHVPSAVNRSELVGPMDGTNRLRLAIGLPLRNPEGLTNLLHDIYNPASPNYHHYLTPEEFTAQFGPTEADYQALIKFARDNNLISTNITSHTHPNRKLLDVEGSVADIERAFGLHMKRFKHPTENREFYAPTDEPSVPAGLSVLDISGLNNYILPHPKYKLQTNAISKFKPKLGTGPSGTYMGADFRAAYVPGVLLTGAGQTVGLFQFDGYFPEDILAYENLNNLPNVPLQNVLLDGYNGAPTLTGGEVEVSLDIEMVVSMAPGVSRIILYEAGPFGVPNDILNRIATDNLAKQIGCSWGWGGGPQASTEQIFLQMDAQGQTFYDASGDSDAFLPGQVDDPTFPGNPSDSPNIVQVGATTLSTTGPAGAFQSETVWQTGQDSGSSGGISSFYTIPPWQAGIDMSANGGSTTHRDIPDVAMCGDNVFVISDQGQQIFPVSGTSCAAPLWAGFTALVNQQAAASGQPPVGFVNPAIYSIGTSPNYSLAFHDTTIGNNTNTGSPTLFFAVPGYDLCTGWGSPTGSNLINILAPPISVPVFIVFSNTITGGNGNGIIDNNECDSLFLVLQDVGPAGATNIQADLSTVTPGVVIAQPHATFPNIASGGFGTNINPFEISTTPTFVCGTPVFLTLTVKCDQNTSTKVFSLPTGSVGAPVRFDNSIPVAVSGGSSVSSVTVSNITAAVTHVAVSTFIVDSFDLGLTLQLISPDGTTVTLAQNNGGSGQNYGIDCVNDFNRTTFDDNGSTLIVNGQPPFIGTFQPQAPLSVFNGKTGTNINGTWQLKATDPFGSLSGIQCWSLLLSPAQCLDGGGQCPGVDLALSMSGLPEPVLVQSNLTYTMNVTNLGPDTATGVALIQTLPASVTFVSGNATQGTVAQSSNLVSCNLGTLVVGQVATVTVVVKPNSPGTIFSTASVGAQQQELNPANNSATVVNHVKQPAADLGISLLANPSPVLLNGLLTYTATVLNHGPSDASNILVTNTLPLNASFVSASATQGTVANSANLVVASLGSLKAGSNAVVTVQVRPQVLGQVTATSSVSSSVTDPALANNSATVNVNVTAASDLVLTMTGPSSVVVGSNITYQLNVLNLGPSTATGVSLRDTLPAGVSLLSSNSPQGLISVSNNVVTCQFATLGVNSNASLTLTVGTSVSNTVVNTASVTASQADPNTTNNTATVTTLITVPTVNVVAAGFQLVGESFVPTNGMIESSEQVTLLLKLENLGNVDSAPNVTATLLNTNGVVPTGSQVKNYGTLTASGPAVAQAFTFTASAAPGSTITANLQVQNNGTNLTVVKFPFVLATSNSFANTGDIIIPDHGPGTPYPSTNVVSGVTGSIGKLTVVFTNANHTFSDDVDMLLVGPTGQNILLMSHAGDSGGLTNAFLEFDQGVTNGDGTPRLLPTNSPITSGLYQPTQVGSVNFTNTFGGTITIPSQRPPPQQPYGANLAQFNGSDANGAWYLYVFDSSSGDQGIIRGGWSLGVVSGFTVNPVVDLGVSGVASPSPALAGSTLTYTFTATNRGPNNASVVQFTNTLPGGVTLVSATNSAHTPTVVAGGVVSCNFTNLASGSSATVTVVVAPNGAGALVSVATVGGSDSDPNQSNNSATINTTVNAPVADVVLTMTGATNALIGSNVLYSINVTNNGPGTALNVVVTDPLQGALNFVSGSSSGAVGAPATNGAGAVVCNVGNLASGAGASISLLLSANSAVVVSNTVTASTASSDPNLANNSATIVTAFSAPASVIVAGSSRLVFGPANGSLVPGQSATVSLELANIGSADTVNLVATLLAANNVLSPSGPKSYGALVHGGPAVANTYSFTVGGGNGGLVSAVLQLADGANNLGTVTFTFNLPATNTFANTGAIIIPDHGPAGPYPATITVSNVSGVVTRASLTLNNYSHKFPNDVQILLAGPTGANLVLESRNGGGHSISNVVLTFDDAAGNSLPATSAFGDTPIVSGTFLPTDDGLAMPFPSPAPVNTSGALLATFGGTIPNGDWQLFVFDTTPGDDGNIANGWSLSLTSISPVNSAADVGVSLAPTAGSVFAGAPVVFNVGVSNKGPSDAANVMVTNTLAAGLNFVSTSLGGYTAGPGGTFVFNLGTVTAGNSTNFTVTTTPTAAGVYSASASVGSDQTDVNLADNTAQASVQVLGGFRLSVKPGTTNGLFALTISVNGEPGTYQIVATTDLSQPLSSWTTVGTITNTLHSFQFTDTNASQYPYRYYRAVFTP